MKEDMTVFDRVYKVLFFIKLCYYISDRGNGTYKHCVRLRLFNKTVLWIIIHSPTRGLNSFEEGV